MFVPTLQGIWDLSSVAERGPCTNISDGIAVPGAPSSAKLSAKLSEADAPESLEIKLSNAKEEGTEQI